MRLVESPETDNDNDNVVVPASAMEAARQVGRLRNAVNRTMPVIADSVPVHYVGYTAVGEVQMASVSILQKPLLHLYSEFLKTGGCTARKCRELFFTENGLRICHNTETESSEQFFHYALITYTNTVVLRTFKSHGKKLYGMFEPTSPLSFTTGDRPGTLFPLEKRFNKIDNIPTFPLVTMLYRPDPPNNHLHCHAFACLNIDVSNQVFDNIQGRVKSFFEDYETLSVDDNMFSTPVPDFWKLTDDGWRMTMTKKKRRQPQTEGSEHEEEEEERSDEIVTEMRRQSKDLAVFAQAKIMSRRQSTGNDMFTEYRVPTSDSGVESPTADLPDLKHVRPGSPRGNRERPKYVRGGVRVLPAPPQGSHPSLSSPETVRRAPPIAPKPKNHRLTKQATIPQPGPATTLVNGHVPNQVWKPAQVVKEPRPESDVWRPVHEPELRKPTKSPPTPPPEPKQYINPQQVKAEIEIETRPVEEWDWEEVGDQAEPELGRFSRGKAIRRPSESQPKSPEPVPFQRGRAIRKVSDVKKVEQRPRPTSFEGPVLMTKSDSFMSEESKKVQKQAPFSPKETEIDLLLSDMTYTKGLDGVERTASMMNFERSLGYLP